MSRTENLFAQTAPYTQVVDDDAVAAFALATNDPNPRYLEGKAVPPLFTATMIMSALWDAQRIGIGQSDLVTSGAHGVHGQHDLYLRGTIRPGMTLECAAATHSSRQTKGGVLVVQQIVVCDQEGSPMVEHLWSNFFPGATIDREVGPPIADHTFPEEARTKPVGMKAVAVDRDQGFRYGGVSGDRVPHALSDHAAKLEGYPGKILQGMCTFAMASGALVDLVADGDPDRLRRLATRFARPAFPLKDLEVQIYDGGRTDDGNRVFVFEAVQDGIAVLKHGRVELAG